MRLLRGALPLRSLVKLLLFNVIISLKQAIFILNLNILEINDESADKASSDQLSHSSKLFEAIQDRSHFVMLYLKFGHQYNRQQTQTGRKDKKNVQAIYAHNKAIGELITDSILNNEHLFFANVDETKRNVFSFDSGHPRELYPPIVSALKKAREEGKNIDKLLEYPGFLSVFRDHVDSGLLISNFSRPGRRLSHKDIIDAYAKKEDVESDQHSDAIETLIQYKLNLSDLDHASFLIALSAHPIGRELIGHILYNDSFFVKYGHDDPIEWAYHQKDTSGFPDVAYAKGVLKTGYVDSPKDFVRMMHIHEFVNLYKRAKKAGEVDLAIDLLRGYVEANPDSIALLSEKLGHRNVLQKELKKLADKSPEMNFKEALAKAESTAETEQLIEFARLCARPKTETH